MILFMHDLLIHTTTAHLSTHFAKTSPICRHYSTINCVTQILINSPQYISMCCTVFVSQRSVRHRQLFYRSSMARVWHFYILDIYIYSKIVGDFLFALLSLQCTNRITWNIMQWDFALQYIFLFYFQQYDGSCALTKTSVFR